jgi:hypothetical protein
MPKKKSSIKSEHIANQAIALAEYSGIAISAAEQLQIMTKAVKHLPLDQDERAILGDLRGLPAKLKKKLAKKDGSFTVAEVASIVKSVGSSFVDAEPRQQVKLLLIAKTPVNCLQVSIAKPKSPATHAVTPVCQFKITLLESHPPIWRRIQIKDCTLDKLHEHIQTAMGWTNSHLHHFILNKQLYGNPELVEPNFVELKYKDSTTTTISDILPKNARRFRFQYEYDFGDSWYHEVLFEGIVSPDSKAKYPLCLEGARACPPDDCGGVWGYADLVEAIGDKKHERHDEMLECVGGKFDPEKFDPAKATKEMRKGLPDWRD